MEMDSIIARLGEMASCCDTEVDAKACTEAAGILFALMDGGCKTAEDTKDLIHDYNALAKQYQAMYKRHGAAGHAVHKDGVWHCPDCNRRVHPHHAFCHSCGKKLDGWDSGKGGASGMANRKQRRHNGKPRGLTYADVLAQKRQLRDACQQAANDTMVQLQSDIHTQRAMWMMCVAMNDAFGIGPERFQKFAQCLQDRTERYEALASSGDEDYANEKLRLEAQRCSGMQIEYLYEAEMLAAERKHEKEGWL